MRIFFKLIVFSLVTATLFYSCTVYYKQNYTPEEVVKSQKKFRMQDKGGKNYPFYRLVLKDSNYYALAKNSVFYRNKFKNRKPADLGYEEFTAYLIDPDKYEKFQVKNTAGSAIATVAIGVVASIIVLYIILDSYYDDFLSFD